MNRLIAALFLLPLLAHAGTYTLTHGTWDLFNGSTKVGSYASETACADAAAALNVTKSYTCKTTTTVNVTATSTSAAPTVSLTLNPTTVSYGQGSMRTWSSTNATSCSASSNPTGNWWGTQGTSGNGWVFPPVTVTYILTCTGPGGSATAQATLTVNAQNPAPTASLTANPQSITAGASSTLSWSSTNATSCSASGGWSGTVPTSGTQGVTPAASTTYNLACTGAGGTANAATTVTVTTGGVASYSSSFNSTENPLNEAGAWVRGGVEGLDWHNPKTTGGQVVGAVAMPTDSRYSDDIAHLSGSVPANQYAQATVYLASGYSALHEAELLLRFQITPHNARGYEVLWGLPGYIAIVRWNGPLGDYTVLYDSGTLNTWAPKHGDVLRAEINGSTISVYKNGTLFASVNDSTYTNGQPGLGFWPVDGAVPENYGWQDWTAGGL
jgi:hypothetical protein